ncbi:RNA polymerase sigma factor [Sphingomonas sp. GB1N7]
MDGDSRRRIMVWVGSEVLPHEPCVRRWLRRMTGPDEVEDIIQESYCRISGLTDIGHIQNGRAYLFTTARMLMLERVRRARVVSIEAVAELDMMNFAHDDPSPERVVTARRELDRVRMLIAALPDRCRQIFEMRKIEGLSQRDVAQRLRIPEYTVENDVAKGLRLILQAITTSEEQAEKALIKVGRHERDRNSAVDQ